MKFLSLFLVSFLVGSNALAARGSGGVLLCNEMPLVMQVFLSNHYSMNTMSEEVRNRTVEQFLKDLDGGKQYFMQSDIDKMRKELYEMFATMKEGKCDALFNVVRVMQERSDESLKWVNEIVTDKFTPNNEIRYQSNVKKRQYAKTKDERRAGLEAALNVQLAYLKASDTTLEKARKQLVKRYGLAAKRMKELSGPKVITMFTEAFAHALDPHSDYLSPDVLEEFKVSMNLSLEGIGVSLSSEDGFTMVQEIVPGGSADRAKALKPKDKIIAVAQDKAESVSIIDMDLPDVVKLIRGKKGTRVRLTVVRQKGDSSETSEVMLVRDKVDMRDQAAKVSYQTKKVHGKEILVAVIDLPSFYGGNDSNSRSCYKDMVRILDEIRAKGAQAIVLDLSTNGGGLLQDAVRISGLFIRKGAVVATQDARQRRDILSDDDERVQFAGPLVVLTSQTSASASEILAGALQDYRRALIVGSSHTYGKGSVQVVHPLMSYGAMKVTTQMFFLPGGMSTQNRGVGADVTLPWALDSEEFGEQYMDYALPLAKTPPFLGKAGALATSPSEAWTPIADDLIAKLKEKSKSRVAADKELQELVADVADAKKNAGFVKVGDILKKSQTTSAKRKERKDLASTSGGRQELWLKSPQVQEAVAIAADWVAAGAAAVASH